MTQPIDLAKLAEPFPAEDIEWRVSRVPKNGLGAGGVWVLAYITARAIQSRLDKECGPEKWKNEAPRMLDVNGKSAFACGISIRIGDEWVTKWDVSEPTAERGLVSAPAKGGFSGAMKRAGSQWGIGRYLYHLDETFAKAAESRPQGSRDWNYATLPEKLGYGVYYWQTPKLPSWALPKEPEHEISETELTKLKKYWKDKFAADVKNPSELREGFSRFVVSVVGEFPLSDYTCWTSDALYRCSQRIEETKEPGGVSADVPFESE